MLRYKLIWYLRRQMESSWYTLGVTSYQFIVFEEMLQDNWICCTHVKVTPLRVAQHVCYCTTGCRSCVSPGFETLTLTIHQMFDLFCSLLGASLTNLFKPCSTGASFPKSFKFNTYQVSALIAQVSIYLSHLAFGSPSFSCWSFSFIQNFFPCVFRDGPPQFPGWPVMLECKIVSQW